MHLASVTRGVAGDKRTIWMMPCFAAALVRFSSPSGWPNFPSAVADYMRAQSATVYSSTPRRLTIYRGSFVSYPRIFVAKSTFVTSRRMRGRHHIL